MINSGLKGLQVNKQFMLTFKYLRCILVHDYISSFSLKCLQIRNETGITKVINNSFIKPVFFLIFKKIVLLYAIDSLIFFVHFL